MLYFLVPPFSDEKLGFRLQADTRNENGKLALILDRLSRGWRMQTQIKING